jgi:hypothetical protein
MPQQYLNNNDNNCFKQLSSIPEVFDVDRDSFGLHRQSCAQRHCVDVFVKRSHIEDFHSIDSSDYY